MSELILGKNYLKFIQTPSIDLFQVDCQITYTSGIITQAKESSYARN